MRPILETALDAVVVMRPDGTVADWNARAVEAFGWPRDETLGRMMSDLIVPLQHREGHRAGLQRYLATGEGPVLDKRFEITALRKSGEEFPVELSITAVREDGNLLFLGFLRDITDRKLNERALARQTREADLLYRVTALAAETDSFEEALQSCLDAVCELSGWPVGHAYVPDTGEPVQLIPTGIWHLRDPQAYCRLVDITERTILSPGVGLPGHIWATGEPCWIPDVEISEIFVRSRTPGAVEIRSAFGFPIKSAGRLIAVVEFFADAPSKPDQDLLLTVRAIGEQVGRVFERKRSNDLLREKKRELEIELAQRRKIEQHQQLLLAELSHRVKNMLAVVMGIAAQTARSSKSVQAFSESFLGRLTSLGRTHSLLTARNWKDAPLAGLIEEFLAPWSDPQDQRLSIEGPAVWLQPKIALTIGMILHELGTNAAKYGALSQPDGSIAIKWALGGVEKSTLRFIWRESGLTGIKPPSRQGFGSKMVEASVRHELRGHVETSFQNDGVMYQIEFPLMADAHE